MKYLKKALRILMCLASGVCMGFGLLEFMKPEGDGGLALMLVMIAIFSGYFLRPERPKTRIG